MKISEFMNKINDYIYSIFNKNEFTGMMVSRAPGTEITAWFYFNSNFSMDIDEATHPVNKGLIKKRMLKCLANTKKEIDNYIERINNG